MSGDPAFDARLAAIRARFITRAADDGAKLAQALDHLGDPEGQERATATIQAIAHGLAGAGGTFGFPEVSAAAEALEGAALSDPIDRTAILEAGFRLLALLRGLGS